MGFFDFQAPPSCHWSRRNFSPHSVLPRAWSNLAAEGTIEQIDIAETPPLTGEDQDSARECRMTREQHAISTVPTVQPPSGEHAPTTGILPSKEASPGIPKGAVEVSHRHALPGTVIFVS